MLDPDEKEIEIAKSCVGETAMLTGGGGIANKFSIVKVLDYIEKTDRVILANTKYDSAPSTVVEKEKDYNYDDYDYDKLFTPFLGSWKIYPLREELKDLPYGTYYNGFGGVIQYTGKIPGEKSNTVGIPVAKFNDDKDEFEITIDKDKIRSDFFLYKLFDYSHLPETITDYAFDQLDGRLNEVIAEHRFKSKIISVIDKNYDTQVLKVFSPPSEIGFAARERKLYDYQIIEDVLSSALEEKRSDLNWEIAHDERSDFSVRYLASLNLSPNLSEEEIKTDKPKLTNY